MIYSAKKIGILISVSAVIVLTGIFLVWKIYIGRMESEKQLEQGPASVGQSVRVEEGGERDEVVSGEIAAESPAEQKKGEGTLAVPSDPVKFDAKTASPISGLKCSNPANKDRRPIAVMLAADKRVRPLSGIGEADMVIEMPVITNMITRLMAVFVCDSPAEIGSIRSARHDYLTLAKGMDAMLAHWGGSHFALDMLKNKDTVPDLDAMKSSGGAFFRKAGIQAPDNGFASYDGLLKSAKSFGYRTENKFEGYPHRDESASNNRGKAGTLTVGFPGVYRVTYSYDPISNSYLRSWNGNEDTDRLTGKRIAPKNVIVVFATSRQIEGQYNDVDIEGSGSMHAFMEGREFKGTWEKKTKDCAVGDDLVCVSSERMKFIKENGKEVEFVPGQIWLEVLEPGQVLRWTQN